jgi:hypothetical protein
MMNANCFTFAGKAGFDDYPRIKIPNPATIIEYFFNKR